MAKKDPVHKRVARFLFETPVEKRKREQKKKKRVREPVVAELEEDVYEAVPAKKKKKILKKVKGALEREAAKEELDEIIKKEELTPAENFFGDAPEEFKAKMREEFGALKKKMGRPGEEKLITGLLESQEILEGEPVAPSEPTRVEEEPAAPEEEKAELIAEKIYGGTDREKVARIQHGKKFQSDLLTKIRTVVRKEKAYEDIELEEPPYEEEEKKKKRATS